MRLTADDRNTVLATLARGSDAEVSAITCRSAQLIDDQRQNRLQLLSKLRLPDLDETATVLKTEYQEPFSLIVLRLPAGEVQPLLLVHEEGVPKVAGILLPWNEITLSYSQKELEAADRLALWYLTWQRAPVDQADFSGDPKPATSQARAPKRSFVRMIGRGLFVAFLFVTLPFVLCGGCLILLPYGDWWIRFSGKVVDPNLDPIDGARLTLFVNDMGHAACVDRTSDKGDYFIHAGGAPPGLFHRKHIVLEVEKDGFKKLTATLDDQHPPPNGFLIKLEPVNLAQWRKETAAKKASFHYVEPKFRLVWCKPGEFRMGSPVAEHGRREGPQVDVTLTHGFWIGQTEVTRRQWKGVMGTTPWEGKPGDDYPATRVDYDDVLKFCKTVTTQERHAGRLPADEEYVLPTEAQWEFAARGGRTTAYSFGDRESELGEYAWYRNNTMDVHQAYAHRVAQKKPNPWALYDVHGNVREWCRDWYSDVVSGGVDPVGPPFGRYRVCRGGGWYDLADDCRSASRSLAEPDFRWGNLGFRVARVRIEKSR